jgi:hypothetical protein
VAHQVRPARPRRVTPSSYREEEGRYGALRANSVTGSYVTLRRVTGGTFAKTPVKIEVFYTPITPLLVYGEVVRRRATHSQRERYARVTRESRRVAARYASLGRRGVLRGRSNRDRRPGRWHVCENPECRKRFRPRRGDAKYHNDSCRLQCWQARRKAEAQFKTGAYKRHGFAEDRIERTLDLDEGARKTTHAKCTQTTGSERFVDCRECGALREGGKSCFHCGYLPGRNVFGFPIEREGELGLVDRRRKEAAKPVYEVTDKTRWHAMLLYIGNEKGYKPGWAAHKFKEKFGEWPSRFNPPEPIEPTPEVRSWVLSRNIAWAHSRRRAS